MMADSPKTKRLKITIEICREIAIERGGVCLSNYYKHGIKLTWRCKDGHTWDALFGPIYHKGVWCRKCGIKITGDKNRKYSLADCIAHAIKRNGICLSTIYINVVEDMQWLCAEGHTWDATFNNVLNKNSWCKLCGYESAAVKQRKYVMDDLYNIAKENGGLCLSPPDSIVNVDDYYDWQCGKCNYSWNSTFYNIQCGYWCRKCNKSLKIHEILKYLDSISLNYIIEHEYKDCRSKSALPFDIYIPSLETLVEFDGGQHFFPVTIFSGVEGFVKRNEHDLVKCSYCIEKKITLIRIAYDENIIEVLKERLAKSMNQKFVMVPVIAPKFEGIIKTIFGEGRYLVIDL